VLLYELLTGTTPFDKERFKQVAYDEICRIVREEDPPKPSTRLSELSSRLASRVEAESRSQSTTLASVAAQRHTEPAKLTKLVHGELDWIVMKALEKDRNRRYEMADGFAMDVRRYLADQPVLAGPPTMGYRFRKFAQRNRRGLVLARIAHRASFRAANLPKLGRPEGRACTRPCLVPVEVLEQGFPAGRRRPGWGGRCRAAASRPAANLWPRRRPTAARRGAGRRSRGSPTRPGGPASGRRGRPRPGGSRSAA